MISLSTIITFIKEKRKILASLFLIFGILNSTMFVIILSKRPQNIRSKASETMLNLPTFTEQFVSPKGYYNLLYDPRQWTYRNFGQRVIFDLNKEYGYARLDIFEGESEKDLDSLKDEIIKQSASIPSEIEATQFNGKPSYLIRYKNEILGEDTYYYRQLVKNNNQFFIFEKRTPNLGYNQHYLDNLLMEVSLIDSQQNAVKGISNYPIDLTTVQLVDLVRPSVANILYVYCLEISNLKPQLSGLIKPKYNFCASTKGSGFVINEEGIIATNGHVVKVYPEEALVTNLLIEGNKIFSTDLIRGIFLSKEQTPTQNQEEDFYKEMSNNPQYIDRFLTEIFRMIGNQIISVATINDRYYVNLGSEPIKVDYQKMNQGDFENSVTPSSTTYTAKLLDFNYPNKFSYDAIVSKNYERGADVALIQIDNSSNNLFPALELGNIKDLREGSEIVVAGYPTLVEGEEDPRAALSYKTSTKPTITRGIISSIKEDLSGKTVLQTDASIDHGNSGGPAFNQNGQVIGIATFAEESQTGNFNFLREVTELKDLMSKNSISNFLDKVSDNWRKGLSKFREKRFSQAIKHFKEVEKLDPIHPTVKEFIQLSEAAFARGESLEGFSGFIKSPKIQDALLIMFGGISITSFISAGFLTILPLFWKGQSGYGES